MTAADITDSGQAVRIPVPSGMVGSLIVFNGELSPAREEVPWRGPRFQPRLRTEEVDGDLYTDCHCHHQNDDCCIEMGMR